MDTAQPERRLSAAAAHSRQLILGLYRRLPASAAPIGLIVLVVLVGNAFYVTRLTNSDPIWWTANVSHYLCHVACGRPAIDPNVGALTQSLGHQAAEDLIHFHFPWWNYYQGLGQPLAGEMQDAAMFPLVVLLATPAGLLWFHIVLEVIAGVSTYLLARRLSMPVVLATMGAMLFSLNGTFAWIGNSVLNPVAFLPMLLLGIEIVVEHAGSTTRRGWYVVAIAVALSLYAGFPEVAYFDGLFGLMWAVVRLFSIPAEDRIRMARRLGIGVVIGVVLALPALVPFVDYEKVAYLGGHANGGLSMVHLPLYAVPMMFDPYVYGTLFHNGNVAAAWDNVGGYFGTGVSALALVGVVGARWRSLRLALASWLALGLAGVFNFLDLRALWNVIPLVSASTFPRYIMPSLEMAVVVLAMFGLADLLVSTRAKQLLAGAAGVMVLVLLWGVVEARSLNRGIVISTKERVILAVLVSVPFVAVALLLALTPLLRRRFVALLIALVVVGEAVVFFMVPTATSPKEISVDYAPIHYLQSHQGEERVLDFEVLDANWPTEFGINSLSDIDLPFPTNFKDYIQRSLYPGLTPPNRFVALDGLTGVKSLESELVAHFAAYEGASVKYLLVPSSVVLLPQLVKLGVTQVYRDPLATIYELPHPRPLFSVSSSCSLTSPNDDVVTAHCASAGARLLRTELSMKGWVATINGRPATITTVDGVYQRVTLPAGTSTVRYRFTPPHEDLALALGLVAALFLVGAFIDERHPFVRRRVGPALSRLTARHRSTAPVARR